MVPSLFLRLYQGKEEGDDERHHRHAYDCCSLLVLVRSMLLIVDPDSRCLCGLLAFDQVVRGRSSSGAPRGGHHRALHEVRR